MENCDKYSQENLTKADNLFKLPVSFVLSVAKLSQLPLTEMSEVAFAGRSNDRK